MCDDWITETYVNDLRHAANKHYLAIKRVRELHKPIEEINVNGFVNIVCNGCFDEEPSTGEQFHHDYPCPTIKALDGD
jgi:hypothetical protein